MTTASKRDDNLTIKFRLLWRRFGLGRKLALTLVGMAVASGFATIATIMYLTRKINWYEPKTQLEESVERK